MEKGPYTNSKRNQGRGMIRPGGKTKATWAVTKPKRASAVLFLKVPDVLMLWRIMRSLRPSTFSYSDIRIYPDRINSSFGYALRHHLHTPVQARPKTSCGAPDNPVAGGFSAWTIIVLYGRADLPSQRSDYLSSSFNGYSKAIHSTKSSTGVRTEDSSDQ